MDHIIRVHTANVGVIRAAREMPLNELEERLNEMREQAEEQE